MGYIIQQKPLPEDEDYMTTTEQSYYIIVLFQKQFIHKRRHQFRSLAMTRFIK